MACSRLSRSRWSGMAVALVAGGSKKGGLHPLDDGRHVHEVDGDVVWLAGGGNGAVRAVSKIGVRAVDVTPGRATNFVGRCAVGDAEDLKVVVHRRQAWVSG